MGWAVGRLCLPTSATVTSVHMDNVLETAATQKAITSLTAHATTNWTQSQIRLLDYEHLSSSMFINMCFHLRSWFHKASEREDMGNSFTARVWISPHWDVVTTSRMWQSSTLHTKYKPIEIGAFCVFPAYTCLPSCFPPKTISLSVLLLQKKFHLAH